MTEPIPKTTAGKLLAAENGGTEVIVRDSDGAVFVRQDVAERAMLRDMLDSLYRRRLALVEDMDSLEERISHLEGTLLKLEGQTDAT